MQQNKRKKEKKTQKVLLATLHTMKSDDNCSHEAPRRFAKTRPGTIAGRFQLIQTEAVFGSRHSSRPDRLGPPPHPPSPLHAVKHGRFWVSFSTLLTFVPSLSWQKNACFKRKTAENQNCF
jgi:hypothetical protein